MKWPKTRAECVREASETEEGIYVSPHEFIATLAFQDRDSERWYYILICQQCGFTSASWDSEGKYKDQYTYREKVGGSVDEAGGESQWQGIHNPPSNFLDSLEEQ